jgi:hypothetical protein
MKIGLISDTHIPSMGAEPPSQVVRAFEGSISSSMPDMLKSPLA